MTGGATGGELNRNVTKPEIGLNEAVTNGTTEDELSRTVTMNARGDNDDREETGIRSGEDAMGMIKVDKHDLEAGASMEDEEKDRKIDRDEVRKRRRKTRARRN